MRFFRQGYWSGLPFPSPKDLPNPGIEPRSPELQADSLPTELQGKCLLNCKVQKDDCEGKKKVKVLVAKLCPSLCNPIGYSPLGSSVHGISQAIILEWVVIPSPGDLLNPGIEPRSRALQADSLPTELQGKPPEEAWLLVNAE